MPILKYYRSRAAYFAVPVVLTLGVQNFPLPMDFHPPAGSWREDALAVLAVNVALALMAILSGYLVLWVLKRRAVSVFMVGLAGFLSGMELVQFAPFTFPLSFPKYVVVAGVLLAAIPMSVTLLVMGYVFGKRSDPASSLG